MRRRLHAGRAQALSAVLGVLTACSSPSTLPDPSAPPARSSRPAPSPPRATLDLIVRGGSVLDGTGRPAYLADIGVRSGRITRIGDLSADNATTVIDAHGLVVAPGFINIHSHALALS